MLTKSEIQAMTPEQIKARIAALEATPQALVASDEGTHGGPKTYRVYRDIRGNVYAAKYHGGTLISSTTVEVAERDTDGRLVRFGKADGEITKKIRELTALKRAAR